VIAVQFEKNIKKVTASERKPKDLEPLWRRERGYRRAGADRRNPERSRRILSRFGGVSEAIAEREPTGEILSEVEGS